MKNQSCNCTLCQKDCKCSKYARLFSVLGNKNRLHIINALRVKNRSVSQLVEIAGMEQTSVSHSLSALRKCGFVTSKREGKEIIYSVDKVVEPLMNEIDHVVRKLE